MSETPSPKLPSDFDAALEQAAPPPTPTRTGSARTDSDRSFSAPGYGPGYGLSNASSDGLHLLEYLRVLYKRRWVAVTALVTVFALTVVYTFSMTPLYVARAQVLIENEKSNVVAYQDVVEQNRTATDYYQTQYRILQSRTLARRVLEKEKLWNHPQFSAQASSIGKFVQSTQGLFTRSARPEDESPGEAAAIDRFLKDLTITPVRASRLVDLYFESPDAGISARVPNALAAEYIEQNLEYKLQATQNASDFLSRQLTDQRKQVEASEAAIQQYREQSQSVSLEDRQNIVVQRLTDLNAALTRARTERIQKQALYEQVSPVETDRAVRDSIPAVLLSPFIQEQKRELADLQRQQAQLGEKLGDRHPDMLRLRSAIKDAESKVDTEISRVVQSIKSDYQTAVEQERSLAALLEQQKTEALSLNRQATQYGSLQRDSATNTQIFEGLLQRAKETEIASDLKSSNVRIVDSAEVPRRPAKPQTLENILFGFFGGLIFGAGLAFLVEYLDDRIKSPEEIQQKLGVPYLGMVPVIKEAPAQLALPDAPSSLLEAFRTLRTSVLFAVEAAKSRLIVVTSAAPGEGKSFVSCNLALSLAQAGHRVLLIDADMRRPKVNELFDMPQEPGLADVLVGGAKPSEVIRTAAVSGLWVLPAGHLPPNPTELAGSRRLKTLLSGLSQHFDFILIDTPPLMAVSDAAVVAQSAGEILFVIGAEMTAHRAASEALERLGSARPRLIGSVLNKVDVARHSYYYAHYYRTDYATYYRSPV